VITSRLDKDDDDDDDDDDDASLYIYINTRAPCARRDGRAPQFGDDDIVVRWRDPRRIYILYI